MGKVAIIMVLGKYFLGQKSGLKSKHEVAFTFVHKPKTCKNEGEFNELICFALKKKSYLCVSVNRIKVE